MTRAVIAVTMDNLVKTFGDFTAVDHVTLEIEKGEIFGFLGPNGAGKSTTIRMLCGLLQPTSGRATVAGFDIAGDPESVRRNIGYMSQKFSLYDDLTVEENINFFAGVYGVYDERRKQRKQYVLEMAGLEERRGTITRLLAGGWKQRMALGCAILHEPPILFLDEPTSGVDPIARRNFWDLIYRLSAAGHTIFVSTHYMDEAEYCHRVGLMYRGRVIALGTPEELKHDIAGSALFALEASDLFESLRALEGRPGILDVAVFGGGLHVTVENEDRGRGAIEETLSSARITILRLERIRPSMEDVFVGLIEAEERKQVTNGRTA